jgi:hypothetical protein
MRRILPGRVIRKVFDREKQILNETRRMHTGVRF